MVQAEIVLAGRSAGDRNSNSLVWISKKRMKLIKRDVLGDIFTKQEDLSKQKTTIPVGKFPCKGSQDCSVALVLCQMKIT